MATNKHIVLIGAGNVATHLGIAFKNAGLEIAQIYSRTEASASSLGKLLDAPFVTCTENIIEKADIYIVSVKDDALSTLIPDIVKDREEALFVHTAGSVPMDIWKGYASRHGVLYPMQTFSKERKIDFNTVSFFVEANNISDLQALKSMASLLSPKVYETSTEQRSYLHAAAVFACNFTNHMYALSARLLQEHGLPFDAMLPLIDETARKVHELSPHQAQTGPAIRRDTKVMDKHLTMLANEPKIKELYQMISNSIMSGITLQSCDMNSKTNKEND